MEGAQEPLNSDEEEEEKPEVQVKAWRPGVDPIQDGRSVSRPTPLTCPHAYSYTQGCRHVSTPVPAPMPARVHTHTHTDAGAFAHTQTFMPARAHTYITHTHASTCTPCQYRCVNMRTDVPLSACAHIFRHKDIHISIRFPAKGGDARREG
eukprot:GHVU01127740.1.p2 GENE.GHVU01127740.1~~GHVU01127740.1.p2  ORF type:complete len:151 (-),score=8.50 GHVU01127740.1:1736-2188(-)